MMAPLNPVSPCARASADQRQWALTALDQGDWLALQNQVHQIFQAQGLGHLGAPATLVLHDLLDSALKHLHLSLFGRVVERDFGLPLLGNESDLETLYRNELAEHGSQNMARLCEAEGKTVDLSFPAERPGEAPVLWRLTLPLHWRAHWCHTDKLIQALGFELELLHAEDGSVLSLFRRDRPPLHLAHPLLLDASSSLDSVGEIFRQLDYGLIQFSAVGEILAVSPALLARLQLGEGEEAVEVLAETIPIAFYNDIIWGLALAGEKGAFENYRIRIRIPGQGHMSILFNVSGFRAPEGRIHSLWQVVSLDEGGQRLAEGSILSEVRIHNITRNYVPQLVEQKARDAVRLGKASLSNEERLVAVMFCDIVGFTSYVERNSAEESVIDTLNFILRRVSGSVKLHRGSIDKFMGDCVMAIFEDPADALLAAVDMQHHADDINALRARAGRQTLQLRIGIHWGQVVIGNVGTAERLDWTAIGDVVNTASRIEKACEPGRILVSLALREAADSLHPARFQYDPLFCVRFKGKEAVQEVCHVAGAGQTSA